MVLEFLKSFGELFDLKDEFPDRVSLGQKDFDWIFKPDQETLLGLDSQQPVLL